MRDIYEKYAVDKEDRKTLIFEIARLEQIETYLDQMNVEYGQMLQAKIQPISFKPEYNVEEKLRERIDK